MLCVGGQAEVKSADPTEGHVSRAIEDLTVVLPVRFDFEETELDDLTRRANCEKKACVQHVLGTEGERTGTARRARAHPRHVKV